MFPGLYVHVPFCKSKCPYCDFFSIPVTNRVPVLLKDLGLEAELYAEAMGGFDSLYIGGGTPSSLTPQQLAELLAAVSPNLSSLGFAREPELTVELNPADVGPELLDVLQQAGVNRLSLGVQSFDDDELRLLGRRHDRACALRAIELIREAGFAALGLDLISDLPGSALARWRSNLEQALSFHPEHLSCYALTIAASTPFGEMNEKGKLIMPDEGQSAALFLETCEVLGEAGYDHYEVSNFARDRRQRSRHNQKYWCRAPYLGLGPAAHSFDGQTRWWNLRDLTEYHRALEAGLRPVESFEEIDQEKARLETIALGIRTSEGVDLAVIQDCHGTEGTVERLLEEGLVIEMQGRLRPTRSGFLVADGIATLLC